MQFDFIHHCSNTGMKLNDTFNNKKAIFFNISNSSSKIFAHYDEWEALVIMTWVYNVIANLINKINCIYNNIRETG